MKITIELEVGPQEVGMATELLAVLRSLTEHVTIKQDQPNGGASPAPIAPLQAAPAPATSAAPAGPPVPAAAAGSGARAPPAGPGPHFAVLQDLVQRAEVSPNQQTLAVKVEAQLMHPPPGFTQQQVFTDFVGIWMQAALDPSLPEQERSAVPFVTLFLHMSQPMRDRIRDAVVPQIIKHFTVRRPVNAPRSDFYMQAEVFAALVSIDMVGIGGAIKTMCTLVAKPDNRAAAVTTFGKTVELCGYMIQDKVDAETIAKMRATVAGIKEEDFKYDKEYIEETMGWSPQAAAAAQQTALQHKHTCSGHTEQVFALAAVTGGLLVSGGRDSLLKVWSVRDGGEVQSLPLPNRHVTSIDFHQRLGMLFCSGLTVPDTQPAFLEAFKLSGGAAFQPAGAFTRPLSLRVPCVRALHEKDGFVTGEMTSGGGDINYYEVLPTGLSSGVPTQSYSIAGDLCTTISRVPQQGTCFVTGSKDGRVQVWDLRSSACVGAFGQGGLDGSPRAHSLMVTACDAAGHSLVTGGIDRAVHLWDLRKLGMQAALSSDGGGPVASVEMEKQVLRVALNGGTAAVSTIGGLFTIGIRSDALSAPTAVPWSTGGEAPGTYPDIKWTEDGQLLCGATKSRVDIYACA